ncbi:hypothetical protein F4775DRAFT_591701 [Biscogniauxia sp. FL1348]|nr:hypothetical protein F4775DRAFT_591701 [Biscogniauxia sp. FL1348]
MPSFTTISEFACGHALVTHDTTLEGIGPSLREWTTLRGRCLSCLCSAILESLVDGLAAVPRPAMRELVAHCELLKRHPLYASCRVDEIVAQALRPTDELAFRHAIIALTGFPEIVGGASPAYVVVY